MGKGEKEGGSMIDFRLCPDAPAVAMDDAPDECQTEAQASDARKLTLAVEALENGENFASKSHIKALAIVFDVVNEFATLTSLRPDLDLAEITTLSELDGIIDQVPPDLTDHR